MDELYLRKVYGPIEIAKIESMGALAVSIANRWLLGWPKRVKALLRSGTYLSSLEWQVSQERRVLADESDLRHLARHEILQMYEIREAPPVVEPSTPRHLAKSE